MLWLTKGHFPLYVSWVIVLNVPTISITLNHAFSIFLSLWLFQWSLFRIFSQLEFSKDTCFSNAYYKVQGVRSISCLRPHHRESTGSRQITEVNLGRASIVLGWVTAWNSCRRSFSSLLRMLENMLWLTKGHFPLYVSWVIVLNVPTISITLNDTFSFFLSVWLFQWSLFHIFSQLEFSKHTCFSNAYYKVQGVRSISCLRPHHRESTGSRQITEVNLGRASIVLGWVTAWE